MEIYSFRLLQTENPSVSLTVVPFPLVSLTHYSHSVARNPLANFVGPLTAGFIVALLAIAYIAP